MFVITDSAFTFLISIFLNIISLSSLVRSQKGLHHLLRKKVSLPFNPGFQSSLIRHSVCLDNCLANPWQLPLGQNMRLQALPTVWAWIPWWKCGGRCLWLIFSAAIIRALWHVVAYWTEDALLVRETLQVTGRFPLLLNYTISRRTGWSKKPRTERRSRSHLICSVVLIQE